MSNQLIQWVEQNRGELSIRKLARKLQLSHGFVAYVLNGERSVSWEFAARVAETMGLDHMEAFQMAGLLDKKRGTGGGGATNPPLEKVTETSVPHSKEVVTTL